MKFQLTRFHPHMRIWGNEINVKFQKNLDKRSQLELGFLQTVVIAATTHLSSRMLLGGYHVDGEV